jgi:hypothetical protein
VTIYSPPGTVVEVLPNPRLINLGDTTRLPAVVGYGRDRIWVTDQPVTATGTGTWTDILPGEAGGSTSVTITQIANVPAIVVGAPNYSDQVYVTGYYGASPIDGKVHWAVSGSSSPQTVIGGILGVVAQQYYASFNYAVPSTHYDPQLFVDKKDIYVAHGQENNASGTGSCGILAMAGDMVLEEGAPGVWLAQSETDDVAGYKAAIDKLKRITSVSYVGAVFPSGSWSQANVETIQAYLKSHCQQMEQMSRERAAVIGDLNTLTASTGGRNKDTEALATYVNKAANYKDKKVTYVHPAYGTRTTSIDRVQTTLTLDGPYVAVAVMGKRAAQVKPIVSVSGMQLNSIQLENDKLQVTEQNILGAGSVCVVSSTDNVVTVRHDLTTDPTSADTQSPTVVEGEFLVKRNLRKKINDMYFGKGTLVTPQLPDSMAASTNAILDTMVANNDIYARGQVSNPASGEVPTRAWQDATEPRTVHITCSVKYLYNLDWCKISVSTFV